MEQKKGMDSSTINILLIGGAALLFYDKIFGKNAEDKKAEQEVSQFDEQPIKDNPLQPSYVPPKIPKGYIGLRTTKTVPSVPAGYYGKAVASLKLSFGTFTDDETDIVNALKQATTKPELSVIAKTYSTLYKRDLFFDLKDNLGAKELVIIFTYLNKLPNYIKGYVKK